MHQGADGTGNLYDVANIDHFVHAFGGPGSADFVTADGGFDFRRNVNRQEERSLHLIVVELYADALPTTARAFKELFDWRSRSARDPSSGLPELRGAGVAVKGKSMEWAAPGLHALALNSLKALAAIRPGGRVGAPLFVSPKVPHLNVCVVGRRVHKELTTAASV